MTACVGSNSYFNIVPTLIVEIVVCETGAVVITVQEVELGSTCRGETVPILVIFELFTAASFGPRFLESFESNC